MLPSFRLIAVTFLCGFFVVFAGLRLAASLNDIHEGLPVMAAHAAPVSIAPVADREARRGLTAVPVMYDLRFAVSTVAPTLVRLPPTVLDRPAPPLAIVPPEDVARETLEAEPAKEADQPEATVAAIEPQAPVARNRPLSWTRQPSRQRRKRRPSPPSTRRPSPMSPPTARGRIPAPATKPRQSRSRARGDRAAANSELTSRIPPLQLSSTSRDSWPSGSPDKRLRHANSVP